MKADSKLYWNIPDSYYDEPDEDEYEDEEAEDLEFLQADEQIEDR